MSRVGKPLFVLGVALGLCCLAACDGGSDRSDPVGAGGDCDPDPCEGRPGRVCDPPTGTCVCANVCHTSGAGECSGGRVRTCVADAEGCLAWTEWTDCTSGLCSDDQNCAACVDSCAEAGLAECEGGRVRFCSESDDCLAWSDWMDCGFGFCADAIGCGNCQNACGSVAESECAGGQFRSCAPDENGCLGWADWAPCSSGFCSDAQTCGECADSCQAAGDVGCIEGSLHTCELDENGCPRWSLEGTACPGGVCADAALCGFTVGGAVTGLVGALTLELDGELLEIVADGTFHFQPRIDGTPYSVAVAQHPAEQQCSTSGGVGVLAGSNVSDIRVDCKGEPLGNLQEISYIKASNTGASDSFGSAVAIDGDTLVVGARSEDSDASGVNGADNDSSSNSGAVYVFVRSGDTWAQQAYLKASNSGASDAFGATVALVGDTLAVGAPTEASAAVGIGGDESNNQASSAGAVYVFVRQGTTWTQQAYIKASNTGSGDGFGMALALSGEGSWLSSESSSDLLAVGAPNEASSATGINGDEADNSAPYAGAVYVFRREGTSWTQEGYVKASNAEQFDAFGTSVALSGDTLVVGAPLEASAARGVNADQTDNLALEAGATYVFRRSSGQWLQEAYLKASNAGADDRFGTAVALSGDVLAVGAPEEASSARGIEGDQSNNGATFAGAVYVFRRDRSTWQQEAYLKASNTDPDDSFGRALGVSGTTLVVGALGEDSSDRGLFADQSDNLSSLAGAAYVFDRGQDAVWRQVAYMKAPNAQAGDRFGSFAAISGDTVVLSAPGEDSAATGVGGALFDDGASDSGAVYVFEHCDASSTTCFPCNHGCPWEGATECAGGTLRTCEADANGCLAWGAFATCADGFCEDDVQCGRCPFYCTENAAVCYAGEAGTCAAAPDVCFDVAGPNACAHGFCFDSVDCADLVSVQWGSIARDTAAGSASDAAGRLFVAGSTSGDMGGTNAGLADAFLTKLDTTGAILWTRQWGSAADDNPAGVVVDLDGNVYVAGQTRGSIDGQTSVGSADLFVTKWTNDGSKLWTVQWGTTAWDSLRGVALASDGNVLVTGQTMGALEGNVRVGSWDAYATKLNTQGARLWTTQWGTTFLEEGVSVAGAQDGSVYVTGGTEGPLNGFPRVGARDAFLTKLDSAGVMQWTNQWGSTQGDTGISVTVDGQGDIYTTGWVGGMVDGIMGSGSTDVFWTKWSAEGTRVWTRLLGTAEAEDGRGVAVASNGDPLLFATTQGALGGAFAGASDVAFFRATPDGWDQVAMQWGSPQVEGASSISVGATGAIHLVGFTEGSLNGNVHAGDADAFAFIIRP